MDYRPYLLSQTYLGRNASRARTCSPENNLKVEDL
jgi:hypothetical protein